MATRLRLVIEIDDPAAPATLATMLEGQRGGRGELMLLAATPGDVRAEIVCGRDFLFDAELVARIERLPGIASARLAPIEGPRLALVG